MMKDEDEPFDMAEHERRWQRLKEAALGSVTRHWSILDDREQHPIVWPVGMIPIKEDGQR